MRSEPTITITCDRCEVEEVTVGLTALARRSYDERNVDGELKRFGWKVEDGQDICDECQRQD